jgi:hypothetical protein
MSIATNAMNDTSIFQRIKERLRPLLIRPGIPLGLKSASSFDKGFTDSVIAECESAVRQAAESGTPLSPAYRLAMHVLLDSAQIDREREPEQYPRNVPA